ncbi:MAG: DMT family transporter [Rhizobacter sp.]|nr:DMT family transporter [Ferruginibacter sp.]
MNFSLKANPRAALYMGGLCISASPVFLRLAGVNGLSTTFYRAFFALLIILPFVLGYRLHKAPYKLISGALAGGMLFSLDIAFWNMAVTQSDVLTATVLGNLAPIWTGILAYFFFKETQSMQFWLGVLLALWGVLIMTGILFTLNIPLNAANGLAVAGSVFYAGYLITTQKTRTKMHTITFMFYILVSYTISSFVICRLMNAPLTGFPAKAWISFAGLAVIVQLAGWLLISYSLGHIRSTEASLSLLAQSVLWPSLAAMIFFCEMPTSWQVAGTMLIILGTALNYLKPKRQLKLKDV